MYCMSKNVLQPCTSCVSKVNPSPHPPQRSTSLVLQPLRAPRNKVFRSQIRHLVSLASHHRLSADGDPGWHIQCTRKRRPYRRAIDCFRGKMTMHVIANGSQFEAYGRECNCRVIGVLETAPRLLTVSCTTRHQPREHIVSSEVHGTA